MIISLNWLKKYVKIDLPTPELVDLIGARLVEIEQVIDQTHKYDHIYAAQVVECEKIPGTKLSLCQILCPSWKNHKPNSKSEFTSVSDLELKREEREGERVPLPKRSVGGAQVKVPKENNLIQVICGAPNVRPGMLAVWIAPGATVPSSAKEDAPFIIGTRKMRGYESHGMLAGADELDFGDEHSAIAELDPALAKPGDQLADLFDLSDTLLDVENKPLTQRPDTFGIIGFAREVAGILGQPFQTPDFLLETTDKDFILETAEKLQIKITDPALCPRYTALIMSRSQPLKTKYLTQAQTWIARSGMRPIDPIVDLTNYLMLLTGQPLHAFDYDKLISVGQSKTPQIIVRAAKNGEKLTLLDGNQIQTTDNDILITSNNIPVALAGAMGGQNTAIDQNTKKVLIESATFSLFNLRRTQMSHGIFSEAITRFTKGQPAGGTLPVVKEFAHLMAPQMKPLAIFDEYPKPAKSSVVKITTHEINDLLGTSYDLETISKTLENVEFSVKSAEAKPAHGLAEGSMEEGQALPLVPVHCSSPSPVKTGARAKGSLRQACEPVLPDCLLTVTAPYWRTDIHIKEDLIEEIGRLRGFDLIPPTTPFHATANQNPLLNLKTQLRNTLSSLGANEILTYSFISEALARGAGQTSDNSYKIVNAISPDLQLFRQSLVPSLLDKARLNVKVPFEHFILFEMNQVYQKTDELGHDNLPITHNHLAAVLTKRKTDQPAAYYEAKKLAEQLLENLSIPVDFTPLKTSNPTSAPFEPLRSAEIKSRTTGETLGIVGEFKKSVLAHFKLPVYSAGFEFSVDKLLQLAGLNRAISPLAFADHVTSIDITIKTNIKTPYVKIQHQIEQILTQESLDYRISPVAIYQPNQKTQNLTFHLQIAHPERSLSATEIDATIKRLETIK